MATTKRIKDTWYSSVVDECRAGDLREDTYNFIHGYPTSACGSSLLGRASSCDCQAVIDAGLDELRHTWRQNTREKTTESMLAWVAEGSVSASTMQKIRAKGSVPACRLSDKIFAAPVHKGKQPRSHEVSSTESDSAEEDGSDGANIRRIPKEQPESYKQEDELLCNFHERWVDVLKRECVSCKLERKRRKRVLDHTETSLSAEFALAPLITAMNKPRYLATQQRARLFAEYHKTQVLWIQAEDFPLSGEIATYPEEKLNQKMPAVDAMHARHPRRRSHSVLDRRSLRHFSYR